MREFFNALLGKKKPGFFDVIKGRRSVKYFDPNVKIKREEIIEILLHHHVTYNLGDISLLIHLKEKKS